MHYQQRQINVNAMLQLNQHQCQDTNINQGKIIHDQEKCNLFLYSGAFVKCHD